MSYILEALKKADADRERGRGAVPGLHAQAAARGSDVAVATTIPWRWLGGGALLAFGAVLAWNLGRPDAPAATAMAPVTPAPETRGPPSSNPPVALPAPPASPVVAPAAPLEPPPASVPGDGGAAGARAAADTLAQPPLPAPTAQRARAARPPPRALASPAAPAEPASRVRKRAPPQAAERPPLLANLPEALRRQVPPIGIGGSVYSALPANRMLIVNGQVLREGGTVAAGLQLEQIGPKAAVFSIHGQRFEVPL